MIISACNFVNNHNFSDFIIGKITEEQIERDEELRRKNKRHTVCLADEHKEEVDWSVKKRTSLRGRPGDTKCGVDMTAGLAPRDVPGYDLVTIETTDSYTLTGDPNSLHISLKKPNTPSDKNVFRRLKFSSEVSKGQGRSSQLMVFQLHSHPSYYLATTQLRHLELQSYCDDTLEPSDPDERFFNCFQNEYGVQILQPYGHKGKYIHHIDNFINIRGLELNLRPPEEFYLHIKTVDADTLQCFTSATTYILNATSQGHNDQGQSGQGHSTQGHIDQVTYEPFSTKHVRAVPDISKSSLKRKSSKKSKTKEGKSGMLSWLRQSFRSKKDKGK